MAKKKTTKPTGKKTVRKASALPFKKKDSKKQASVQPKNPPKVVKRAKIKSPLSKKELEKFRRLLLEKRRSLLGDMSGIQAGALGKNLQESSGDLSNMPTHPADIGSDNFEHEFTLGLLESERSLLREINEALERIDNNTFGVCLGTGEPIGVPRLLARPWCKYCIEYQKMIEKGLIRPGEEDRLSLNQDEEGQENREDEESEEAKDEEENEAGQEEEAPEIEEAEEMEE